MRTLQIIWIVVSWGFLVYWLWPSHPGGTRARRRKAAREYEKTLEEHRKRWAAYRKEWESKS